MCLLDMFWHDTNVQSMFPADFFPECKTVGVVVENEKVAFPDPGGPKGFNTSIDETIRQSFFPEIGMYREMMDVAAPSVMSGQYYSHYPAWSWSNEAHPRVSFQISPYTFPWVGIAQSDALASLP